LHGDALRTGVVVFGDDAVRHFVVCADEVGGDEPALSLSNG
jgi:hypothetical protein